MKAKRKGPPEGAQRFYKIRRGKVVESWVSVAGFGDDLDTAMKRLRYGSDEIRVRVRRGDEPPETS